MKKSFFSFFWVILLLASCNSCNQPSNNQPTEPAQEVVFNAPPFNTDSAYQYIQSQVDFGPRPVNSKGHEQCGKWLIEISKQFADTVYVQPFTAKAFDGTMLKATNIIASFNPSATTRVLLTAHWDTRPWADQDDKNRDKPILGACDGASGVGVLIEIARAIRSQPMGIGLDILFNDAEDYGYSSSLNDIVTKVLETEHTFCLGSQHWARNPHVPGYQADFGILLDMAGAKNALFTREGTSSFNAGWVQDKVWNNAAKLGYGSYFSNRYTPPITDDHFYINQITKIPTVDIIPFDPTSPSGTFPDFWHTHKDVMEVIDKNTLKAVGETVLYTLYQYNAGKKTNPNL